MKMKNKEKAKNKYLSGWKKVSPNDFPFETYTTLLRKGDEGIDSSFSEKNSGAI